MEDIYFKDVFEYPVREFRHHFESEENDRIVFSGKYGTGKTRFLKEFFSEAHQTEVYGANKYQVFRISPVNYSIATNEDIIRYIKYDIITEMLKNSLSMDDIKLTMRDTFPYFAQTHSLKMVATLVYMIPKIGKEIIESFDKIDDLKTEYLKYHEEMNRSKGDMLVEYLEQLELKAGSVYENDLTTKIISEAITKESEKESVLIIDDVDRLDPDHVFRILNVFAAHFDAIAKEDKKNKFNFDKVIIVCDFDNIRNIFHHRYGADVDFMGYIDKFYSSGIYHFDNKDAVREIVSDILLSIRCMVMNGDRDVIFKKLYIENGFLSGVIGELIQQRNLSLRSVLKLYKKFINYHYGSIIFDDSNSNIDPWVAPITMQLRLLLDLFGNYKNMRQVFEQHVFSEELIDKHRHIFGAFIYILSHKEHNFYSRYNEFAFTFGGLDLFISVQKRSSDGGFEYADIYYLNEGSTKENPAKGNPYKIDKVRFKKALLDALEILHVCGYLH